MILQTREEVMEGILFIIRQNPGIRPTEINRIIGIPHTASHRLTLIQRGLIRKVREGQSVRYYPI